ncbi:MAG: glucose 1-dehydrogenase [Pseudomonadota bacterium]|nr:glucose 1-dehydrogenase [Pseudomonadota bacterium]
MNRLKDKVALVTGGGSGLGRAQAICMAEEGARVVVTDVNDAGGEQTLAQVQAAGGQARYLHQDVRDEDRWQQVIEDTLSHWGHLDVVVNNAGIGVGGTVEDTSLENWRHLMGINLDAVFLGTKHGIRAMKATGGGSIINLSSIEGLVGDPNLAAYNASKGGVRLLTKSAALHCAKAGYGIRVNSVHPGYIETPMVTKAMAGDNGDLVRAHLESLHPLGRLGQPNEIAWGVVFLASDESGFMTGSELVIDGGYTAQ